MSEDPQPNEERSHGLNRRTFLNATGGSLLPLFTTTATGAVSGCYAPESTTAGNASPRVTTASATDVTDSTAVLRGEISGLEGSNAADCYFEWWESDSSVWNDTDVETVENDATFEQELGNLDRDTQYNFRAVAEIDDVYVGGIREFSTEFGEADIFADMSDLTAVTDLYTISDPNVDNWNISTELANSGERSIVGRIPEGNNWGGNCNIDYPTLGYGQPDEVYQQVWFYLSPTWEMEEDDACRIWNCGLNAEAGDGGSGGEGPPTGTNGWSSRLYVIREPSLPDGSYNMATYTYHIDQQNSYGETEFWDVSVPRDRWHQLETYVKMNSVTDGVANYDGIVRCWVNGENAYERTDFRWRSDESMGIQYSGPVVHYGGPYTAPTDMSLYIDDHGVYVDRGSPN